MGYPAALEAALKLKEMALVHAEGAEAWEMTSGAATMLGPDAVVIALAPDGPARPALADLLAHAAGWGARTIEVGPERLVASSDLLPAPRGRRRGSRAADRRPAGRAARVRPRPAPRGQPGPPGLDRALPQPGPDPHPGGRRGGHRDPDRARRRGQRRVHPQPARRHPVVPGAAGTPRSSSTTSTPTASRTAERMAGWTADALGAAPSIPRHARPPRGARGRRLRDQHDPGRRRAGDPARLRHPGPLRPALHDQRHDQRRRRAPRPAHDPGRARASPPT